jgi:arylsulfatase A-like enzyme
MDAVRAHVRSLNVANMARIDTFLAPALRALRETGRLADTLVILTSDHGENLYEHADDYGHSHAFNASSAIPLVLHVPGAPGARDDGLASLVDLAPTIYGWTGVAPPQPLSGRNLLTATPRGAEWIYVQGWDASGGGWARALVGGGQRILRHADGREALYDQAADPGERDDLAAGHPERVERERRRLDAAIAAMAEADDSPIGSDALPADVRERLRRLGYVE